MNRSWILGLGLLLAGVASQNPTSAQYASPYSPYSPYAPGYIAPPVYPAPGSCLPGTTIPVYPGTVTPGTTPPGKTDPDKKDPDKKDPDKGKTPGTGTGTQPGGTPDTEMSGQGGTDAGSLGGGGTAPSTPGMGGGDGFSGATGAGGSGAVASAAPGMIGDLHAAVYSALRRNAPTPRARVPIVQAGAFKISENESPRPVDRVFLTYNYFSNVNIVNATSFNLHREVVGFEKTFMNGDASFGVRVPYLMQDGLPGGGGIEGLGDLTFLLKFALINDPYCGSGNVLSSGFAVTAPTGRTFRLEDGGDVNTVLLQPWLGWILGGEDVFFQGFTSMIFPTDDAQPILASVDLGFGCYLYRSCDCLISSITPTIEFHATLPLRYDSLSTNAIGFPFTFVVTTGVHIGIGDCSTLTIGAALPTTGPQPFDFEGIAQLNFRF